MIYLDYSATTPVDKRVLETFNKVSLDFIGNPNSLHRLGVESKGLIDKSIEQIKQILNLTKDEIIFTSGSSEANNLAIKGICEKYHNRGKHIITTELEHSSIYGPLNYLSEQGFEVDFVKLDEYGRVDLENLKDLIRDDTILVTITAVNSEVGIVQPINEIAEIVKAYPKCYFHVDATQAIGKIKVKLDDIDLISFSAHKFFGLKGVGCLIKKENLVINSQINGGKSTTVYRSGTPTVALDASLAKALRLIYENIDNDYEYVKELNQYIREKLSNYEKVNINSNEYSIPHILNLSVLGIKPETMLHALEEFEIYISTQSACATGASSKAVMAITGDINRANSSIRISLSKLTTKEELDNFLVAFDKCYNKLLMKK
ncbi:MAG: cysteine desulfurase [Firmicutes bacterium]|nr:cysteine desulfurase [Bacillota bacterium]